MRRLLPLCALVAACGTEQAPPFPTLDGGPPVECDKGDPALPPEIEIGTGVTAFEPLADGDPIPIIAGPQGGGRHYGFHVWLALTTRGLSASGLRLAWTVRTASAGVELGNAVYVTDERPVGPRCGAYGMRVIFADCCAAENQDLSLELALKDINSRTATAARRVHTGECPGGLPNPTIDPCP